MRAMPSAVDYTFTLRDGVTAEQYQAELEANLASLLERFKSGQYLAPAVRRAHILKPDRRRRHVPSAFRRWKTKCFSVQC